MLVIGSETHEEENVEGINSINRLGLVVTDMGIVLTDLYSTWRS